MKKILKVALVISLGLLFIIGSGDNGGGSSTGVIDNSKLQFVPPFTVEVEENQKSAIQLKAVGCTDKPRYEISEDDFIFNCDPRTGVVNFKEFPNYKQQREYKFIAIATGCVDERVEEEIVIKIKEPKEGSTTSTVTVTSTSVPTVTPTSTSVPTVTPTSTPVPIVTPTPTPVPIVTPTPTPVPTIKESDYFITTWKTDNEGESDDNQIKITTNSYNNNYDYNIDWGDGTEDIGITGDMIHTYNSIGIYTIKISSNFPQIYFTMSGYTGSSQTSYKPLNDNLKLLSIEQWGAIKWESMNSSFRGCSNLSLNANDVPNLLNVTDMTYMLQGVKNVNQSIRDWDISNIEVMHGLFKDAKSFNININSWNMSNLKDITYMFDGATSFNQNINSWDVSNITSMVGVFRNTQNFNQNIGNWDTSNVIRIGSMFSKAISFNQDISNWNLSNVTSMSFMFNGAKSFNQDISNWDVSSVTSMQTMFTGATVFNQNISSWDVSKVTDMYSMFANTESFSGHDLSSWDVSSVTNHTNFSNFWGTGNTEPNWQQ